jgi:hypothetical protein
MIFPMAASLASPSGGGGDAASLLADLLSAYGGRIQAMQNQSLRLWLPEAAAAVGHPA